MKALAGMGQASKTEGNFLVNTGSPGYAVTCPSSWGMPYCGRVQLSLIPYLDLDP